MTKRRIPRVQVRGKRPKVSPYRRTELELANTREAFQIAVDGYIEAVQALNDLLGYWDHPRSGWTHKDTLALERIRKIAEGK